MHLGLNRCKSGIDATAGLHMSDRGLESVKIRIKICLTGCMAEIIPTIS